MSGTGSGMAADAFILSEADVAEIDFAAEDNEDKGDAEQAAEKERAALLVTAAKARVETLKAHLAGAEEALADALAAQEAI